MQVQLDGQEVRFIQPGLPEDAQQELEWCDLITHIFVVVTVVQFARCACMSLHSNSLGYKECTQRLQQSVFPIVHHLCAQSTVNVIFAVNSCTQSTSFLTIELFEIWKGSVQVRATVTLCCDEGLGKA